MNMMKVAIDYTIIVDDNFRMAIRKYQGRVGLATRWEIKQWYKSYGHSLDEDILTLIEDRKLETES